VYRQRFMKESVWFHHYLAKKEAKRLEKEAKLAAKAAKAVATATTSTPAGEKKAKEKAAKDGVVPFVNMTPKGQKKGEFLGRWEEA
jgi:N-acetylmuramoyl-L-alanine amidase CwlA